MVLFMPSRSANVLCDVPKLLIEEQLKKLLFVKLGLLLLCRHRNMFCATFQRGTNKATCTFKLNGVMVERSNNTKKEIKFVFGQKTLFGNLI